jgi:uncharacterized beta-barrel protein YwiB (DUF1934 family)
LDLKNGTPIKLTVASRVTQENIVEEFSWQNIDGQLVTVNGTDYLRYTEETEFEGKKFETSVTIKVKQADGKIEIIRNGQLRMKLTFEYGQYNETMLNTPAGMMYVTTNTKKLVAKTIDTPTSGVVEIDYDLFAGETVMGNYEFKLTYTA